MILNKFRSGSVSNKIKALSLQLLALSLFSCNKNANINANKAYIGMTHVAYGVDSLSLYLEGALLFNVPISFGQTTGIPGDPYDTATSRVSYMLLSKGHTPDTTTLLQGNSSFQQGAHYSIFAYDSLDQRSIGLIILQDNPPNRTDTLTTIRFLNFSPGSSYGIKFIYTRDYTIDTFHISVRDTVILPLSPFVGYNPNPGLYTFSSLVHIGMNQVFAFTDSSNPNIDSSNFLQLDTLQFDSTVSYNVYMQGFRDSATSALNKLQIRAVPLSFKP